MPLSAVARTSPSATSHGLPPHRPLRLAEFNSADPAKVEATFKRAEEAPGGARPASARTAFLHGAPAASGHEDAPAVGVS